MVAELLGQSSIEKIGNRLGPIERASVGETANRYLSDLKKIPENAKAVDLIEKSGRPYFILISKYPMNEKSLLNYDPFTRGAGMSTFNPYRARTNKSGYGGYAAADPREQVRLVIMDTASWEVLWAGSIVSDHSMRRERNEFFSAMSEEFGAWLNADEEEMN